MTKRELFATWPVANKPDLAARMIGRFLGAWHRADWVAADEVFGGNPKLRSALEIARSATYWPSPAHMNSPPTRGEFRADALAAKVPKRAWQKGRASRTPSIPQSTPKALAVADRVERGSWPSRGAELVG
jgi:hypothetical protein